MAAVSLLVSTAGAAGGAEAVGLGAATSFAVLAGSGITNTGPTTIDGDVGSFPTTTQSGFETVTLSGVNHRGDAVTQQAKDDLTTAYNTAAGSGPPTAVAVELGGRTLTPGVYSSGTLGITGTLTLDTLGDPRAVFIFQAASTLTTASSSAVVELNGGLACNVFWQVGSSATLGTTSRLIGTVLANESITATTGATIQGRLLARGGAVTLDTNTITNVGCNALPSTTTTPTTSPAPGESPTGTEVPVGTGTPAPTGTPGTPGTTGRIATTPTLPRTGINEWLVLAGAALVASGALVVGLATARRKPSTH